MVLGCLTGNGKISPIDGYYTYRHRGLKSELFPDLMHERVVRSGLVPFSKGSLTDGDLSSKVGWKGTSLGEIGVDVHFDLKGKYFIDRIVIIQEVNYRENYAVSGLSNVEVFAKEGYDEDLRLVGRFIGHGKDKIIDENSFSISLGQEATYLIVRLNSFNRNLVIKELEMWGSSLDEPKLFPIPQKMKLYSEKGYFKLTELNKIIIGANASTDTLFAAKLLQDKIKEDFNIFVPIEKEKPGESYKHVIVIGINRECKLISHTSELKPCKPEGYKLKVNPEIIFISALDRRGLIYGVEALLQLFASEAKLQAVSCYIDDYPTMTIRGVHFGIPPHEEIPFIKRLIRYLLVPMRINTIFLQVTAGMKFDKRPEINEKWKSANQKAKCGDAPPVPHGDMIAGGSYLTKEDVRDLICYARKYGFEVIPEIQSLSHVQYLTLTYPEIAENREDYYPDSYCPLNPKSHKIVFDMIDEVTEVFKPLRYVHMGHDEVYTMAKCDKCKGKSRAELYAYDVNKIYHYLKSKGLGMMIWGDMLQPFLGYSAPEAIDMIPKDIILLDFVWYFRLKKDIEDRLLKHGFKVIMGNFYSSHYPRFRTRRSKDGILGAEVSTWCRTDEYTLAAKGKIYDFIYSANMMWTTHYWDELRWTMDRKIRRMIPKIRCKLSGKVYPSLSRDKEFIPLKLDVSYTSGRVDGAGCKGAFDLSSLPKGKVYLEGVPFILGNGVVAVEGDVENKKFPSEVNIQVNKKLESIIFLHTCSHNYKRYNPIGFYTIIYDDGSTAPIKVEYGWNIAEWNRRYADPLSHVAYRHEGYIATYTADPMWQGKTAKGEDITLYGYEWINPHDEKSINSIKVRAYENSDSVLILVAVTGVKIQKQ